MPTCAGGFYLPKEASMAELWRIYGRISDANSAINVKRTAIYAIIVPKEASMAELWQN
jgi:hypothetical protein